MPRMNDSLRKKINEVSKKQHKIPFWQGPLQDGITCSLLTKFLECRERFRVKVIDGLVPKEEWNHKIGYGNMWHLCEEIYATNKHKNVDTSVLVNRELQKYCKKLCERFPLSSNDIEHWYNVCLTQFPIYVDYWSKLENSKHTKCLLQEHVFDTLYTLPSGNQVKLKGKFDRVDKSTEGYILREHKTKGQINTASIESQLNFDMQTMFYIVALDEQLISEQPINRYIVNYNVVRRPLSGGKGTIKQKQNETKDDYYNRLAQYIKDEPEHYFMRWNCAITREDINRFKSRFLHPVLEQLCDWYSWIVYCIDMELDYFTGLENRTYDTRFICPETERVVKNHFHYQHPYGLFNSLSEGSESPYDGYITNKLMTGLTQCRTLYPELEE